MNDDRRSVTEPDAIARILSSATFYLQSLPEEEQHIARLAAAGTPVWEIANEVEMSEAAVARLLDGIVAAVSGREVHPVESGGLGADTDPGVTGGYDVEEIGDIETEVPPVERGGSTG